jgi:hypothetical protein
LGLKETLEVKVQREIKAHKVMLDQQVQQVQQGLKELKAQQDTLVPKVMLEVKVPQEIKGLKVMSDQQEEQVQQVLKVLRVHKDQEDLKEVPAPQVTKALKEQLVR